MGQAFRRATGGRIGNSSKVVSEQTTTRTPPPQPTAVPFPSHSTTDDTGSAAGVLEDRDPQYDSMLTHMVGRIQSKPGGKLEMGEASVVDNYNRPLPKVRNTTTDSSRYEHKPAPPGTLNVAQLRQIILLYRGDPPMTVPQLAHRFRIDAAQVQCILKSVSLPPSDAATASNNKENE